MVAAYRVLIEGVKNVDAIQGDEVYRGLWFKADEEYIGVIIPKKTDPKNVR
jgi:hypothetical protein